MKNKILLLGLIALILVAACTPIEGEWDWCIRYDFIQRSATTDWLGDGYNFQLISGVQNENSIEGGWNGIESEDGLIQILSPYHDKFVAPQKVSIELYWDSETSLTFLGNVYGVYANGSGTLTGDESFVTADFGPQNQGDAAKDISLQIETDLPVRLGAITVFGIGANPFPTNDCDGGEGIPTIPPVTASHTASATVPSTATYTPSVTMTASATLTPSVTSTASATLTSTPTLCYTPTGAPDWIIKVIPRQANLHGWGYSTGSGSTWDGSSRVRTTWYSNTSRFFVWNNLAAGHGLQINRITARIMQDTNIIANSTIQSFPGTAVDRVGPFDVQQISPRYANVSGQDYYDYVFNFTASQTNMRSISIYGYHSTTGGSLSGYLALDYLILEGTGSSSTALSEFGGELIAGDPCVPVASPTATNTPTAGPTNTLVPTNTTTSTPAPANTATPVPPTSTLTRTPLPTVAPLLPSRTPILIASSTPLPYLSPTYSPTPLPTNTKSPWELTGTAFVYDTATAVAPTKTNWELTGTAIWDETATAIVGSGTPWGTFTPSGEGTPGTGTPTGGSGGTDGTGGTGGNDGISGGIGEAGGNIFKAALGFFSIILDWLKQVMSFGQMLIDSYWTAQPEAIPGLPLCVTAPELHDLCAVYYILDYTLFAPNTPGALIVPFIVLIINIFLIVRFIRYGQALIKRASRMFGGGE